MATPPRPGRRSTSGPATARPTRNSSSCRSPAATASCRRRTPATTSPCPAIPPPPGFPTSSSRPPAARRAAYGSRCSSPTGRMSSRIRTAACAWTCTGPAATWASSWTSGHARTPPAPTRTSRPTDHHGCPRACRHHQHHGQRDPGGPDVLRDRGDQRRGRELAAADRLPGRAAAADEDYLQLSNAGARSIVRDNTSGTPTTLASGTVAAPGTGTWQHLALTFSGSTITAAINGTTVGRGTDSTYATGLVGFGTSGYQTDQFDNLSVTPAGSNAPTGPIVAGDDSAKCVDDNAQSTANGTKIQMWDCNSGPNQQWTIEPDGTIQVYGKCMDITGANYGNGTLIELWDCNAGANQQWKAQNGTLVNPASGKCLDDPGSNTANGTQLDLWTCNGGSNQQWHLPS